MHTYFQFNSENTKWRQTEQKKNFIKSKERKKIKIHKITDSAANAKRQVTKLS